MTSTGPPPISTTSEIAKNVLAIADAIRATAYSIDPWGTDPNINASLLRAAALRLDELERENARMRAALEPFANVAAHDIGDDETDRDAFRPFSNPKWAAAPLLTVGDLRRARAALAGSGEK
jgi:hypothetical protein